MLSSTTNSLYSLSLPSLLPHPPNRPHRTAMPPTPHRDAAHHSDSPPPARHRTPPIIGAGGGSTEPLSQCHAPGARPPSLLPHPPDRPHSTAMPPTPHRNTAGTVLPSPFPLPPLSLPLIDPNPVIQITTHLPPPKQSPKPASLWPANPPASHITTPHHVAARPHGQPAPPSQPISNSGKKAMEPHVVPLHPPPP